MLRGQPANRTRVVVLGVIFFLSLLFVFAFRQNLIFGLALNCVSFLVFFALWLGLISFQALLPVSNILQNPGQTLFEVYRAAWYLVLHIFRLHGPAVFVKDGKQNSTPEDLRRENLPGVVIVDYNSVVVLEERNAPASVNGIPAMIFVFLLRLFSVIDRRESPRVRGKGIVFTRPRERIRGVVDTRTQFRMEKTVSCYTRDGIELQSNAWALFTIGQDAEILQVSYIGEMVPENLRVVKAETLPNGQIRISGISDELDEADRQEIHRFYQRRLVDRDGRLALPRFTPYRPFEPWDDTLYQRVFAAVCAQARNGNQEVLPWTELPTRVAAGIFRELLSQVNYDALYAVGDDAVFPLPDYKRKMRTAVRNNGILAFRLLRAVDCEPLVQNQEYNPRQLEVSQQRRLINSKVLRDRGIRVVFSGFGDLIPVNEEVYRKRLDSWRAEWDSDLDETLANSERAAMRARGRAHVLAQQDLWQSLNQLFEQDQFAEEALALRVLQALEQAAADPKTRALLPANTVDVMRYVSQVLLPPEIPPMIQQPGIQPGGGGNP